MEEPKQTMSPRELEAFNLKRKWKCTLCKQDEDGDAFAAHLHTHPIVVPGGHVSSELLSSTHAC